MQLQWIFAIHSFFLSIIIIFQICLAVGLPWGSASMGGKFPGVQPPSMRFVAVINALLLVSLGIITGVKTGFLFPKFHSLGEIGIWVVVAFFGLGTFMNSITPSKIERIWAPIAGILFLTSLWIGIN
ncbi:MAG: hypothetical protein JJT78_13850 [Leptospira sp.]|nr:hypothetical protein [Leptospira sp.]